ncbi:hypothetical protein AAHK20_07920 [Trinickia sp. YCB016]
MNRNTVAAHVVIIQVGRLGARQSADCFDHPSARIDALLRQMGIVADVDKAATAAANDAAHAQVAYRGEV